MYKIVHKKGLSDDDRVMFTEFRKNYKNYPYLYSMEKDYEDEYQDCYQSLGDRLDMFVVYDQEGKPIAVSMSTPFDKKMSILSDFYKPDLDLDLDNAYYFADIVINKKYHGQGIARELYTQATNYAKNLGISKIYALLVNRDNDPCRPDDFHYSQLWKEFEFSNTGLSITCEWPTFQLDGSVKMDSNKLDIYMKKI
ncbi:GNAT family N-acetyltransferase [Francisellaceae bacterium CB300]